MLCSVSTCSVVTTDTKVGPPAELPAGWTCPAPGPWRQISAWRAGGPARCSSVTNVVLNTEAQVGRPRLGGGGAGARARPTLSSLLREPLARPSLSHLQQSPAAPGHSPRRTGGRGGREQPALPGKHAADRPVPRGHPGRRVHRAAPHRAAQTQRCFCGSPSRSQPYSTPAGGGVKTHPPEPTGPRRNAPTAGVSEAGWWPRPSFPTKKRGEGKNVARGGGRRRRPRATDPPRPRGVGAPPPPLGSVFPPLRCPAVKRGFGLGGHDRSGCLVFLVSALCSSA